MLKIEVTGNEFFYTMLVQENDFEVFEDQCNLGLGAWVTLCGNENSSRRTPITVTMRIDSIKSYASEVC